jgi:hypothetical protein
MNMAALGWIKQKTWCNCTELCPFWLRIMVADLSKAVFLS